MSEGSSPLHIPVLHTEVCDILAPQTGEVVLDCTLGLGGHSALFLERIGPSGSLIALDADAENIDLAKEHLAKWKDQITIQH